jgi:uncharacterized protein (DUF58 family)
MLFSSTPTLKCEYAAEVVTSLFHGILQTGNSVGYAFFNKALYKIAKPALGKKQFYGFTREIYNPKNYGGEKDMARALQQTLSILDKRGLIFIVSDFINKDEKWVEFLKILAEKNDVIGIMIRDPRDIIIPDDAGQFILEDPFSKEKIYIDTKQYSQIYNEYNQKQLRLIRSVFQHNKAAIVELTTDKDFLTPLLHFFKKRGGRWK